MNNTFIPNTTPDGSEKGEHLAQDLPPAIPTACIKLPETTPGPSRCWSHMLINEAAEITEEMWASLKPSDCSGQIWEGGPRARVTGMISHEKRGKIFPLSWDRVQFLADQAIREWRYDEVATVIASVPSPLPKAGEGDLGYDSMLELISSCLSYPGHAGRASHELMSLCHRIAHAAYQRGAEDSKELGETRPAKEIGRGLTSSPELRSRALGEQAALVGMDVVVAALSADVPLPIPPGSAVWAKIRPEID